MSLRGTGKLAVMLALGLLAAGCASTPPPEPISMRDPAVDFGKFKTFGWVSQAGSAGQQPVLLLDQNIRGAIAAELNKRGYVAATEKPDLLVAYEVNSSDKVESSPVRVGIGMGSWGGNVGGSMSVGTSAVRSYKEGSLIIHAVDASRNAEVWQGQVAGKLSKGSTGTSAVYTAVGKAMKDFPVRPAGQ